MIKLDLNPPHNQLRQFAWIGLIGFPLMGYLVSWNFGAPDWVFHTGIALGVLMGVAAITKAHAIIRPVYVGLMVIAYPIGMVIATVLLSAIYFGMFTPVGLLFRLTGRDLLHRKVDRNATSYWSIRQTQRTPASYLRLY